MQENIQDWLELDQVNPAFQLLTEEEITADVIKDSAMEEESDYEADVQESKIKKKLLSSTRDGTDAVINYVDSSTNKKLQEYYEHLRTVREILIKEQQHRSVQTKLDSFFKPALLRSNRVQFLSLLLMNKCIVFLQFLNKGSTVIFFYLYSSAVPISLHFPFICVLSLSSRAISCFTNLDDLSPN
jgi:chlorite dismutase